MIGPEGSTILAKHVAMLREHFDVVEIVAVTHSVVDGEEQTHHYNEGGGCWATRFGLMSEWVLKMEARIRASALRDDT